jgi:hypothetical protein
MLFSAFLTRPHFLCGQVDFGRGIEPRRDTGTLTLRFAVAGLPGISGKNKKIEILHKGKTYETVCLAFDDFYSAQFPNNEL